MSTVDYQTVGFDEAPRPLNDYERNLLHRMFSDWIEVPGEWKDALRKWLEADPPSFSKAAISMANVVGLPKGGAIGNPLIKSGAPDYVAAWGGNLITSGYLQGASGGSGKVLQIGDDASLYDVNQPNSFGIQGVQDPTQGGVFFGNGTDVHLYKYSPSTLALNASFYNTGYFQTDGNLYGAQALFLLGGTGGGSGWDTWLSRYSGSANLQSSAGLLIGSSSSSWGWGIGTLDGGAQPAIRAGNVVVSTNASGDATINFSSPFANTCLCVITTNGDAITYGPWVAAALYSKSNASFTFRVETGSGPYVNTTVRVHYIAFGY